MNDNERAIEEHDATTPETGEPQAAVGPDSERPAPALTPPPASAPGEFLTAQGGLADRGDAGPSAPDPVTPPPASAPTEFLDVQQWQGRPAPSPAELMADLLSADAPRPLFGAGTGELESGIWPLPPQEPAETEAAVEVDRPAQIRGFPLARGEEVTRVLLPDAGLSDTVPPSGQALILTSRRLIAFRGAEGFRDTHVARVSSISQFSVRTGQRNWTAVLQGLLLMLCGGFLYLVVGYWLAGRFSGPNVPVLNIDVAPLIALLIILAGLLALLQNYFTRPAGAVIFRGTGLEIAFPFRSALDARQIYEFVDLVQKAGQQDGGAPEAESPEDG